MGLTNEHIYHLANSGCKCCSGTGFTDQPSGGQLYDVGWCCGCVYQSIFKACLEATECQSGDIRFTPRGTASRPQEEFKADFLALGRRATRGLPEAEWFEATHGPRPCTRTAYKLRHFSKNAAKLIGYEFVHVKPYPLFPFVDYFSNYLPEEVTRSNNWRNGTRITLSSL